MDPIAIGAIGLILLLVFLILGMPLHLAFVVLSFLGMVSIRGWDATWGLIATKTFSTVASFEWSVIPLFTLMGVIFFECGVGKEIFSTVRQWLGHITGGLAAATSGACALLGTMTGSGWATAAVMSKIAYPEMRRYGYQPDLALAVCASSATVAMLIPPSIVLVVLAILAEVSVGKVLLAGFIPGILSMALYMIMILVRARLNPTLGPPLPVASWRSRLIGLRYLLPVMIMMITIIGGIYFGIFTATEAAGAGSTVAFIVVIAMRRLTWARLKTIILETVRLSVMIMLILMTAMGLFTIFLTVSKLTLDFAGLALSFPSPWMTLLLMFFVMFIFGMFIGTPLAYVTIPLFTPVIISLGYDVIWFIILIVKMIEVGAITPPVAISLFISRDIVKEVPIGRAYKSVLWFIAADVVTVLILVVFPQIVLFLPATMR